MFSQFAAAKMWGFVLFRGLAELVIVVLIFANAAPATANLAFCFVVLIGLASQGLGLGMDHNHKAMGEKLWFDELTNRFFYRELLERIRNGEAVDVDALYTECTKLAIEDIQTYNGSTIWKPKLFTKFMASIGIALAYSAAFIGWYGFLYLAGNSIKPTF